MSDTTNNKYERPTVSVQKQLRRASMSLDEKRSKRVMLRLETGCISRAFNTTIHNDGTKYSEYGQG